MFEPLLSRSHPDAIIRQSRPSERDRSGSFGARLHFEAAGTVGRIGLPPPAEAGADTSGFVGWGK